MPKSATFNKAEVIQKAVEIVEEKGVENLTARALGEKLGTSARPIFTTFDSMADVTDGVTAYAKALYRDHVAEGLKQTPAFKGVGMSYIRFAEKHPRLFRLLFMAEHDAVPDSGNVLNMIEDSYDEILRSITDNYPVDVGAAKRLYLHMWIYTHGIATLTVNRMCAFTEGEVSELLTEVFKGLITSEVKRK